MILHPRPLLIALALCSSTAGTTGCAGKTVMVDGRAVPYAEAEQDAFGRARDAFAGSRWDEAAGRFAEFLRQFPESDLADEARLKRAQALSRAGKLQEAQAALQDDLLNHPTSKLKGSEAVELGVVQGKLGKKPDAQDALKPAVDQMSDEEKKKAASSLAEAYAQSGQHEESVRWAARAVESADPREQQAKLADYARALESAPADDVAKLVAELDHKSPAWPPAALKLARIQLHLGDRTHAVELAGQIAAAQQSGPEREAAQGIQLAVQGSGNVKPSLVGVILPLSGEYKGFAEAILDAISLRIDLLGKGAVQLEVKDTKNDPVAAAQAVEELARDGVIAIIGPIGLAEAPAAAARAQQLGVPIVSLSRAENLTGMGSYVFRNMVTNSMAARAVAEYAQKKLNVKTVGILQPDSSYGDEMVRYFWDAIDAGGGAVTAFERYPRETTTFKPFVAKMVGRFNLSERKEFMEQQELLLKDITDPYRRRKALSQLKSNTAAIVDFDALFVPDGARTVRLVAPAIAAEDIITSGCDARDLELIKKTQKKDDLRTVQLLGTNLWDSPDLVDDRMGAARYVQCAIFADGFFAASQRAATQKFVADYDSAYHKQPGYLEAHGHDAAGLLREVIEKKHPQTREQLRDLLAAMDKPFEGAAGDVKFGPDREAKKNLFWLWINRGVIQEFDPDGPPPVPPAAPPPADESGKQSAK